MALPVSITSNDDSSTSAAPSDFKKLRLCATKQLLMGLFTFVLAVLTLSFPYFGMDQADGMSWKSGRRKSQHEARLGAVASLSEDCDRIGTRMLEEGGNAVDAVSPSAISVSLLGFIGGTDKRIVKILAAEFCLGVVGMVIRSTWGYHGSPRSRYVRYWARWWRLRACPPFRWVLRGCGLSRDCACCRIL
jgi:hypothetical protein